METPQNRKELRKSRNPTPRLSDRKKELFSTRNLNKKVDENDDILLGLTPLTCDTQNLHECTTPSKKSVIETLYQLNEHKGTISFLNSVSSTDDGVEIKQKSPVRRSLRLNEKKCLTSPITTKEKELLNRKLSEKENVPRPSTMNAVEDEELQVLFNTSMHIVDQSGLKLLNSEAKKADDKVEKRRHEKYDETYTPKHKIIKLESISIPTRSFYSITKSSPKSTNTKGTCGLSSIYYSTSPRSRRNGKRHLHTINRGVRHKIRRPTRSIGFSSGPKSSISVDLILNNIRNEKLRKLITSKRQEKVQIEKVHSIFRNGQNPIEMARPLSALSNGDDSNNNNMNITTQKLPAQYDIELIEEGFSDIDSDNENSLSYTNDIVGPVVTYNQCEILENENTDFIHMPTKNLAKRKFFKSGRATNTKKEVKITDNIKASVCNGKLLILDEKKKYKRNKLKNLTNEFSDEQATVDEILKNLDDTAFGDVLEAPILTNFDILNDPEEINENNLIEMVEDEQKNFSTFRNRLPYNTTDPEVIEQQQLMLDFLISFEICNEENFNIFIADPENHKEEASRILNEFFVKDHMEFRERIPHNTSDPKVIEEQNKRLDYLIEHDICTEENFDIFITNYDKRKVEADKILADIERNKQDIEYVSEMGTKKLEQNYRSINVENENIFDRNEADNSSESASKCNILEFQNETNSKNNDKLYPIFSSNRYQPLVQKSSRRIQRTWAGGNGTDQYQIDAGQNNFGAQQCKQCGLLYNVHEPEEEKVHRDFHSSLNILRYKGWIDEDIVALFPEWGNDGRIIRLTNNSHTKRKERLIDILKIVDKELGFSSFIFPKIFVAYCAVRKNQIVGICLVQPLNVANKYICVEGVDCCTEEEYEAKCGISRIWVSPLHRRLHIASKLIQAVQLNTIPGEQIPLDKIAFSAPTEAGKIFAQKVTNTENILVYQ